MSSKYYFPLSDEIYESDYHGASTYNGHGIGKLDFSNVVEGDNVYSMTDGTVKKAGKDSTTAYTSVDILADGDYWHPDSAEGVVIRYYHIVPSVSVGDIVSQGDIIGTVDAKQEGTSGVHLHLDFCNWDGSSYSNGDDPDLMEGNPDYSDYDSSLIEHWKSQDNVDIGRCWQVIATDAEYVGGSNASVVTSSAAESAVASALSTYCGNNSAMLAGIMGNFKAESGFDPLVGNGEGYYGLFQLKNGVYSGISLLDYLNENSSGGHYWGESVTDENELISLCKASVEFLVNKTNWLGNPNYATYAINNRGADSLANGTSEYSAAAAHSDLFLAWIERAVNGDESLIPDIKELIDNQLYGGSSSYLYQDVQKRRDYADSYYGS